MRLRRESPLGYEECVAGKGTSEGAVVFMNSDTSRVTITQRLNNKMIESVILLFKSPGYITPCSDAGFINRWLGDRMQLVHMNQTTRVKESKAMMVCSND